MPTYDYICARCGPFDLNRPMAEFQKPQPCPRCRRRSERALLSAPMIAAGRERSKPPTTERAHPVSCSCCGTPRWTKAANMAGGKRGRLRH